MPLTLDAAILDALAYHLSLFVASPVIPVAHAGLPFTPPVDGGGMPAPYLETSLFLNKAEATSVDHGGSVLRRGLYQVAVIWRNDVGHVAPLAVAADVVAHFARGTDIARNGYVVRVISPPWAASPLQEEHRVRVPVTIPWRCRTA